MIVAVFCIHKHTIDVGFAGDAFAQASVNLPSLTSRLALHKCLLSCLDALLVANRSVSVVVVEPPLLSVDTKQLVADILLGQLGVASIGFLQRSVCVVAAVSPHGAGLLIDSEEELVVPVFDFRELTPFIKSLGELSEEEVVGDLVQRLAIDARKPVKTTVVRTTSRDFEALLWKGASALAMARRVWPLLTHEKHKQGVRVWDSLYDVK